MRDIAVLLHLSQGRTALAETSTHSAATGKFSCYVCGYDTRKNPDSPEENRKEGWVEEEGIGTRHESTRECMKLINYFIDRLYYLERPHHREDSKK